MPKEGNKLLKHNHEEKPMKVSFIIYADFESSLKKVSTCCNNPEKSSKTKICKHTASGYSLFTNCWFNKKNKLDYYRGTNCLKNVYLDSKEHDNKKIWNSNRKKSY